MTGDTVAVTNQGALRLVATSAQGSPAEGWTGYEMLVTNAADFDRAGGWLQVPFGAGEYEYTEVTEGADEGDPDILTMATTAPGSVPAGEFRVDVWPLTYDTIAEVVLPDADDDTLQARVPHSLKPLLSDGVREDGARESVTVELQPSGWALVDMIGYETPNLVEVSDRVAGAQQDAADASAAAGQAIIAAGGASGDLFGLNATAPTERDNGTPLQSGDKYWRLMSVTPTDPDYGRIRSIQLWDGNQWAPFQIVADSVLVPSSIGDILMKDGAVTARVMNTSELYVDLKFVSPTIETSENATTGIKIVGDRLVGYGPGGEKQIDIGGPDGIIKGVTIEGALMTGGVFQTDEEGPDRVVIGVDQQRGPVIALRSSYFDKPLLLMAYDNIAGAASVKMFNPNYDFPYATWDQFGLKFTHDSPTWGDLGGIGPFGNLVQVSGRHGLRLDSTQGDVTVNGVDVAGREEVPLSSHLTLVRQGRIREVVCNTTVSLASGANVTIFGTVPAADRPPSAHATGVLYVDGGWMPGAIVTPAGAFIIVNRTGQTLNARTQGRVVWTV